MTARLKRSPMAFIAFLILFAHLPAHSETLKISATGRSFTQLPIRIAQVKGFYRDEDLEVAYVQMTGQLATTSLFGGHVDATTAFSASATAYIRGLDAKGVIVFCDKPTFILVSKPQYRSVTDLRGKTIAVSSFGTSSDLVTRNILAHFGLNPTRDATILALGQASVRLAAMQSGTVDATILSTPENIVAERSGFRRIAESAQFIEMPLAGLVVTQSKIDSKRDQAKRMVKATLRGLHFLHQNRQGAIDIATEWMKLDREFTSAGFDATLPAYSQEGFATDKGILTMLEISTNKKTADINPSKLTDFSMLREALAELKSAPRR